MTLDQIRYFLAAAKHEHLGRAARSIPISISVISHSIKTLEEEFQCDLFTREKKRMQLTQQGVRLMEFSKEILGKMDGIKQELGRTDIPLFGHYRIGASHFLAAKLVTPVWTDMQNRYPQLSCDVYSQATWVLVDNILAGRIDFGVGFSPVPHPQMDSEEIYKGHCELVVRKNHPIFANGDKSAYKDLGDYPATMHMATSKIVSVRQFPFLRNAKSEKNIAFGFDSDFAAVENLRRSNNWSMLIDVIAAEFSQYLRPIPTPHRKETEYTIQILKHKSKRMDPAMTEAYQLLKEEVNKMKKLDL
ncbi:MAG: LysR family transcriptional regulator [Bdellovibrionota bacterium]